jgi:tubulysin polyketide synthase-like protein
MVTAVAVLATLRDHGVEFHIIGDRLRFRPASRVSHAWREALATHKAEIVALLAAWEIFLPPNPSPGC